MIWGVAAGGGRFPDGFRCIAPGALEACLTEAGLPAVLTPVDGGEARIDWEESHEVLARDFEQWTTTLPGPTGIVDPATHDAFMDVEEDPGTFALAPSLWVDGEDHTDTWVGCLEESGYTNPTVYLEQDPGDVTLWNQRMAEAANDWIACAREHGMSALADVNAEGDDSGYGPHVEIPLDTEPALLRTVIDACPSFNEEVFRRQTEGDPTVDDDIRNGKVAPNPTILVEEPEGMQEEGFDFESPEYMQRSELLTIVLEAEHEFAERYGHEQVRDGNENEDLPVQ
ncbi:MAG: hypothetical protein LBH48_08580 [Bifidobacteriaceae bacterium]|nr:hypothetical protein [Bifidobacteriaceae bacterium]